MAVNKTFQCDLSEESVTKGEFATVRVGQRDWRIEDYIAVDIGRCCVQRPIEDLLAFAAKLDEGNVH